MRRLLAASLLAVALVVAALPGAAAAAVNLAPDATVTYPAANGLVPMAPIAFTGTAVDDVAVSEVRVAFQDKVTKLWWRSDGTWGSWQQHQATLASPGAPATTWTRTWTPPSPGAYNIQVEARDDTGLRDPTRAFQQFTISDPPDAQITFPAPSQVLEPGPISVTGTATDDVAVREVRVAFQDKVTKLWWRSDGTWGSWQQHQATLASPGAPATTWTYTWTPPADGTYNVQVEARDDTGLRDPTRPFQQFRVVTPEPAYLSLIIGRSHWAMNHGTCAPLPGSVTLDRVAAELGARGLSATGGVVVPKIGESSRSCSQLSMWPTWSDLAGLRDAYGWTFVPRADSDQTGNPPQQQYDNSCGLLPELESRGHHRGWGLFMYANNTWEPTMQEDIVSTCFAYGRTYGSGRNVRTAMGSPWLQSTRSFNGGLCNAPALPCYTAPSASTRRYEDPALVASAMSPSAGSWNSVQFYQFVEGSYSNPADVYNSWDCTGADWRSHRTSRAEIYCFSDFLAAVDQIPEGVIVTDPATVAEAWGRTPS